jgi:hypothetical protein
MAKDPAALQLRLLQTVVEVAGEKNSTLVMPVPVELLRFFEKMAPGPSRPMDLEPADRGDEEVAAAEAAITHAGTPELGEAPASEVPEVEAPAEVDAVPELASGNGMSAASATGSTETP